VGSFDGRRVDFELTTPANVAYCNKFIAKFKAWCSTKLAVRRTIDQNLQEQKSPDQSIISSGVYRTTTVVSTTVAI
jgi:hypothetical protein